MKVCKEHEFLDTNKNDCVQCSNNCLTCGPTASICTSCDENEVLVENDCVKCTNNCLTCGPSPSICTSCDTDNFVWYQN